MMTADASGAPVTLEQMLAARDRRAARQQAALSRFGRPIVCAGAVMPGPVKDNPQSRTALAAAVRVLDDLFAARGWPVCLFEPTAVATGPEALYVVDAEAGALKRALIDLEDSHPLGRLWDLDVIDPKAGILSRRAFSMAPRRCLVCGGEAHACARSQRHALADLTEAIARKIEAFQAAGDDQEAC